MALHRSLMDRTNYLRTKLSALQIVAGRSRPTCSVCGCADMALLTIDHALGRGAGALARRGSHRSGAPFYRMIRAGKIDITDLRVLCVSCNQLSACYGPDSATWPSALAAESGWVRNEISKEPRCPRRPRPAAASTVPAASPSSAKSPSVSAPPASSPAESSKCNRAWVATLSLGALLEMDRCLTSPPVPTQSSPSPSN